MSKRGEVVMSGYLTKSPPEKSAMSQWRRRWFVLADSKIVYPLASRYVRFEYYASEEDAKILTEPKGVINLKVCQNVLCREPLRGYKYVFDVCCSDRVYHLNADTAEERDSWISTLSHLLFSNSAPPSPGPTVTVASPEPHFDRDIFLSNSTYAINNFGDSSPGESGGNVGRPLRPVPPSQPRETHLAASVGFRQPSITTSDVMIAHEPEDIRRGMRQFKSQPALSAVDSDHLAACDVTNLAIKNSSGQQDELRRAKQPPKVVPYKEHKRSQPTSYYEMVRDEPPSVPSRLSLITDAEGKPIRIHPSKQVTNADGKSITTQKLAIGDVDSEYSYLQASPPKHATDDSYSHLDLSSIQNNISAAESAHFSQKRRIANDDYSRLSFS